MKANRIVVVRPTSTTSRSTGGTTTTTTSGWYPFLLLLHLVLLLLVFLPAEIASFLVVPASSAWRMHSSSALVPGISTTATPSVFFASSPLSSSSVSNDSKVPPQQQQQQQQHVLIVGGGVGGLAVAARIAAAATTATKVTILEKNAAIGGRCGSFWVSDLLQQDTTKNSARSTSTAFRHEQGPSLLLLPHIYEEIFTATTTAAAATATRSSSKSSKRNHTATTTTPSTSTSSIMNDYGLNIVQCVPAYQVIFDDGDRLSVGFPNITAATTATNNNSKNNSKNTNHHQMMMMIEKEEKVSRSKMNTYETNGAEKFDDYMELTSAYLNAGLPNFIEETLDLPSLPQFLLQSLKGYGKAWPLKPHSEVLDAMFASTKLKAVASFQDLYVGLEPYQNPNLFMGGIFQSTAPAVFGLLAAIELHPTNPIAGVFAPVGGFQAVTDSLERLALDLGVDIQCNITVTGVNEKGVWIKNRQQQQQQLRQKIDDSKSSDDSLFANDDEFLSADLIIINADLPYAKQSLLCMDNDKDYDNSKFATTTIKNKSTNAQQSRPPSASSASASSSSPDETFDWDDKFSFSSGVISFYWSLDTPLDDLNTHNVFLSTKSRPEAEASWQVLRKRKNPKENKNNHEKDSDDNDAAAAAADDDVPFNFYVHRPSKTDPSAAPVGCDTIMVLVPCRTLQRIEDCANLSREEAIARYHEQFTPAMVADVKRSVLKRFATIDSLMNLEDHILHEEYRTPATWADRYNLAAGTPFGLSHGFGQLSLTRPSPASSGLSNVLYCGASTRPGNGVPLVLIGAKQVAEKAKSMLVSLEDADKNLL